MKDALLMRVEVPEEAVEELLDLLRVPTDKARRMIKGAVIRGLDPEVVRGAILQVPDVKRRIAQVREMDEARDRKLADRKVATMSRDLDRMARETTPK